MGQKKKGHGMETKPASVHKNPVFLVGFSLGKG